MKHGIVCLHGAMIVFATGRSCMSRAALIVTTIATLIVVVTGYVSYVSPHLALPFWLGDARTRSRLVCGQAYWVYWAPWKLSDRLGSGVSEIVFEVPYAFGFRRLHDSDTMNQRLLGRVFTARGWELKINLWFLFLISASYPGWVALRSLLQPREDSGVCENCGYNLTGNVSGVCPECGKAAKSNEREQRREAESD